MTTAPLNQPFPSAAVLLPEIGPDAHLNVTIEALEALEGTYGEDYLAFCFDRLDAMTISVLKAVAGHAVRGCTVEQLLSALRVTEASKRVADALSMSINGRTVEEEIAKRQADNLAHMERVTKLRQAMESKNNA